MKGLRKMYYVPYIYPYQYPYYVNVQRYNYARQSIYRTFPNEIGYGNKLDPFRSFNGNGRVMLIDHGPKPYVVNINEKEKLNAAMSEELKQKFKSLMIKYIIDDFLSLRRSHLRIVCGFHPPPLHLYSS